jgi:hypothetical protein
VTDENGAFSVSIDDVGLQTSTGAGARGDLQLTVLAPEEPGVPPEALVLYSSTVPRQNAAATEQYVIRLTTAQLQKAEIPLPSEVAGKFKAMAARQNDFVSGAISAAQDVVLGHRTRVASFQQKFKTALQGAVSNVSATAIAPERFVAPGQSVFAKSKALSAATITGTINDPTKRAPIRGFISLTADQVTKLKTEVAPDGTVSADAVAAATGRTQTLPTTYVQGLPRLPLCQPKTPSVDCTDSILNPPPPPPPPSPTSPTPGEPVITSTDVPRFLGRLIEPLTAPEEQLVVGLMPVATRDSVQDSVQSFVFNPSPADVPAFHDFNNLQIAFDYVWQEAIDQGVLDLAQNAYETIVGLGGNPDHPDYSDTHPVRVLALEGNLVLNAHATPTVVVRDHRGESPGTRVAPPGEGGVTVTVTGFGSSDANCPYASAANVRDHRAGVVNPLTIADPVERLPALLQALNKKLLENYNFTIYAANAKERSVNFGILNTFRQYWTPLSYQAGPLVKTIPLAPKQTQKVVITRKTIKKRTQKELENNLRVLKQETSDTNRAEQNIANKASRSTSLSVTNEAKMDMEVGSDTLTTGFKQDTAKSSEDTKKSFHEAVFKAAQEFKEEKTTEINTEETREYESVETTEITNPNDEIAVTFLFYELQRRYRIYERLYRVQPVILVAQEFPQPSDIDQAWLVRYDWILKRAILDDSYLPTLANLAQTAGDEIALEEMKANVNQQRCIVQSLKQELAVASQQATAQRAIMDQAVYQKAGGSSLFGLVGDIVGGAALGPVEHLLFGDDAAQNASNRQALQDRADEAAERVRDLTFRMEREVTALNALTETYTKALRDHNNHLTDIARLQVHVKDNIMHYMQAIWAHEPPDQRFFRLHNTPVPDLTHQKRDFRIGLDHPLATTMAPPHASLPRFGGLKVQAFPLESVTTINPQFDHVPLSKVADVSRLLGFIGNLAIFPLFESNPLTDFMMDPYVDRATGQLVDPSDPLNWSLDEFSQYVCCLKEKLTGQELEKLRPELQKLYQIILSNPQRDDDVLIVPTNSLFIEALPAEHTLLERFKLDHRMIDVKKAQAEAREKELDNVRMAARILSGERGDPHVDKKILIEGGANFVVPAGDQ